MSLGGLGALLGGGGLGAGGLGGLGGGGLGGGGIGGLGGGVGMANLAAQAQADQTMQTAMASQPADTQQALGLSTMIGDYSAKLGAVGQGSPLQQVLPVAAQLFSQPPISALQQGGGGTGGLGGAGGGLQSLLGALQGGGGGAGGGLQSLLAALQGAGGGAGGGGLGG